MPASLRRRFLQSAIRQLQPASTRTRSRWPNASSRPRRSSGCNRIGSRIPDPGTYLGSVQMKYAIVTFGCRVNQADSLRLEEELRARGGAPAATADADIVVVNTCSVTASADQGARQTIRRIARDNPASRIVVTGCYATRG